MRPRGTERDDERMEGREKNRFSFRGAEKESTDEAAVKASLEGGRARSERVKCGAAQHRHRKQVKVKI